MKIAIIVSQFNVAITDRLLQGAEKGLQEQGLDYEVFRVPGAFEIPLMACELAASGRYQGLIALGVVIKGETDHYDRVCGACVDGIRQVMLEHRLPIIFEVLMVHDAHLAIARSGERAEDNKGYQAAYQAVTMVQNLEAVRKSPGR